MNRYMDVELNKSEDRVEAKVKKLSRLRLADPLDVENLIRLLIREQRAGKIDAYGCTLMCRCAKNLLEAMQVGSLAKRIKALEEKVDDSERR